MMDPFALDENELHGGAVDNNKKERNDKVGGIHEHSPTKTNLHESAPRRSEHTDLVNLTTMANPAPHWAGARSTRIA